MSDFNNYCDNLSKMVTIILRAVFPDFVWSSVYEIDNLDAKLKFVATIDINGCEMSFFAIFEIGASDSLRVPNSLKFRLSIAKRIGGYIVERLKYSLYSWERLEKLSEMDMNYWKQLIEREQENDKSH